MVAMNNYQDVVRPAFKVTDLPSVVKGQSDWRDYRPFQLENGMQCMLVHDKESKSTAMSIAVNAGASSDPRCFSGLAHFTEHMCFLGSAKYPGENEYKKFLSSHGGRSNASTSMSFTTFKFDVLAEHAEQAVDIFSQFFIAPLFTESGTSREVQAVDSENTRNIADDGRRRLQVIKALADPNHHFSKFSTGNKETLAGMGNDHGLKRMRKAVLAFHRKHYKPQNMVCVIVGPQSLDQLQEWIVPKLASIHQADDSTFESIDPNEEENLEIEKLIEDAAVDAPPTRFEDSLPEYNPAFSPKNQDGKWPILVTLDPLKLQRKLVLLFPLPSVYKSADTSPVAYLSHLLGYEGIGSPFAVLQDSGLVNSISTGSRINAPDQCLFQVDINLTESGEERWREVVQVIFEYIRLIQQTTANALSGNIPHLSPSASYASDLHRIWEEISQLKTMNFNFTSPGSAYDFAPALAQSIMCHGTKYSLTAGRKIIKEPNGSSSTEIPMKEIYDFSTLMTPENCILERFSKRAWEESNQSLSDGHSSIHDNDDAVENMTFGLQQEKWYGLNYIVSSVDKADVSLWKEDWTVTKDVKMHLPKPNPFLPRSFALSLDLPEEARKGPRIEKAMDPPNLVYPFDDGTRRLWHRLDDRYALPKSSVVILLRNPCVEHIYDTTSKTWIYDETSALCSSLLIQMFHNGMAQLTYDSSLAGLGWSAETSTSGMTIAAMGYSDRVSELTLFLIKSFCEKALEGDNSMNPSIFLTDTIFTAAKDRLTRSLQSYFTSGRADSHAYYYRDFLLNGRGKGTEHKLEILEKIQLSDIVRQRNRILAHVGSEYDCLYSGNVGIDEAKRLFVDACSLFDTRSPSLQRKSSPKEMTWIPGPVARKLSSGEDVELHFASRNPEEQSGAVVMTFQSPKQCFKGTFFTPNNLNLLRDTAALRLVSHILREPFFNELRTKQQLGYVVHSSYELAFNSAWKDSNSYDDEASTIMLREVSPLDSIVMSILSKNTSPVDVAGRIDNFLTDFRHTLENMPSSEIKDHAASLSKQLRKPIQHLSDEVSIQFSKIQLYAPEILSKGGSSQDFPWDNAKLLSDELLMLERSDILQAWDTLVTSEKRSRITSFVYGKSFPFRGKIDTDLVLKSKRGDHKVPKITHYTLDELLHRRLQLDPLTTSVERSKSSLTFPFPTKREFLGLTAIAVVSFSLLKLAFSRADDKNGKTKDIN